MKHPRKSIAALTLIVTLAGSGFLYSSSKYSQKTYLSTRSQSVNTAMEYSLWNTHAYDYHPLTHTSLQIAPFFQKSQNGGDLGKYFGIGNQKNNFTVGFPVTGANASEIDKGLIIHSRTEANTQNGLSGTVSILPEQEIYGARMDWVQSLNCVLHNFFISAHTALVHVSNDMGLRIKNSSPANVEVDPITLTETTFTLEDFFSGKVVVLDTGSQNLQLPLTKAKIVGKRSASGFADIELRLGYKAVRSESINLYVSIDGLFPTGNSVRGEYVFEPVYGNGRHYGLGASVDFGADFMQCSWFQARLFATARYKYLFESTEERTLGLDGIPLGQYFLTGKAGSPAGTPLVPAANILTLPLRVRPGSMIDSSIGFGFTCHKWAIDLGYNIFWRDHETVHIKQDLASDTYAIAVSSAITTNVFNINNVTSAKTLINAKNLPNIANIPTTTTSATPAKTPSLLSHKFFAGLGYNCNVCDNYMFTTGIGGSYEFADSNADVENFAIWIKANISF